MDAELSRSPIATVQLIPIFNYLNLLSDFLFTKQYLAAESQNQQIPIVNALYEYLDDYHDHPPEKEELIRYLLQGSDLYGEQYNENLDPIFVNKMFDYIISSLVFDKYGNIYGFLLDSIRNAENLQFDYLMTVVKANLKNSIFYDEFGANSTLTSLAVDRIYKDIILPLFPEPKENLSILSLDYIFAQAGSTYLRLGKINHNYYFPDLENDKFVKINELNLFDDYLAVGHIIRNLLLRRRVDPLTLRAFALPALSYYIHTNVTITYEMIPKIIFHPRHWREAYRNFFRYVKNSFEQIETQLTNDYTYKIHLAFLNFQNRATMARHMLKECGFLSEEDKNSKILPYIQNAENFKCNNGVVLPNVNDRFVEQIKNLSELYGKYDTEVTQQYFKESVKGELDGIVIKLLVNDRVTANAANRYDLLEFYFPYSKFSDYFALLRENYTASLTKVTDDHQFFQQTLGLSLDEFLQSAISTTLKFANEGISEFFERLMNHRKGRFENYLNNLDHEPTKKEWWKEFGLSLVPEYPCLLNNCLENVSKTSNLKFFNKFEKDISSYITNMKTRSLLSLFGTTIKTVFVKNLINQTAMSHNASSSFVITNSVCEKFSLDIEKPECEALSITEEGTNLAITIIDDLKRKMDLQFTFVSLMLNNLKTLKSGFIRNVSSIVGEKESRTLFVNTLNKNTGYGYKFIINDGKSKTDIVALRTVWDLKEKMLISFFQDLSKNEKKYVKVNFLTFDYENDYFVYETNKQLSTHSSKLLFSGIPIHDDNNDKCSNHEYLVKTRYFDDCPRHRHSLEKAQFENEVVQTIKNHFIALGKNMTEDQIRDLLEKYTLPDDITFIKYFVKHWTIDDSFEESYWSESLIIDNSDLLNQLRYNILLEKDNILIDHGKLRINSFYTYRERREIEEGTSIENIINDYNEQKASYAVTFEDYYAIRNFATTGDKRISGDTNEAKLMKLALYKLAIRQSDDHERDFELKLFRVECKPKGVINSNDFYLGKHVTLRKFTLTSTSIESALKFSACPTSGFRNILYEIEFFGHYFRAKIETKNYQIESFREKKIILLPGINFIVKKISFLEIVGLGNVLKIVLASQSQSNEKYEWFKKIMREINGIKL